jgi:hypothetical protein
VVEIRRIAARLRSDPLQVAFADPDCPICREKLADNEPDSWRTFRG